jgi:hypothetical protein
MDHRNVPRHVWEGVLNGAGFVIGSAAAAWIFVHVDVILAFSILRIVLWLVFRNSRHLRSRFQRDDVDKFIRAIRSSVINKGISSQSPDQETRKGDPQSGKAKHDTANPQTRR